MATTPNGFWYPSPGDTINSVSGLFAQQAASSETALNNRILQDGIAKFNDAAERSAAYIIAPPSEGTMTYLRNAEEYERWNGTAWEPLHRQEEANIISGAMSSDGFTPNTTWQLPDSPQLRAPSAGWYRLELAIRSASSGSMWSGRCLAELWMGETARDDSWMGSGKRKRIAVPTDWATTVTAVLQADENERFRGAWYYSSGPATYYWTWHIYKIK